MASEVLELNICEFCRQVVALACTDPDDCVLGHESLYVAMDNLTLPERGSYRVRLANGQWRHATAVFFRQRFIGFEYRAPLFHLPEWSPPVGYVAVDKV